VVNAIMDTAYASIESGSWEPVALDVWRGIEGAETATAYQDYDDEFFLIKEEMMPDGKSKVILKEKVGGAVVERIT
jgi:hypothetical protein